MHSTFNGGYVDFDLTYPVFFDETGLVEFKFRKDSIGDEEAGYIGEFSFIIDGQVQFMTNNPRETHWQVKSIQIDKGYHTLLWRYTKLNILPLTEYYAAEIEVSAFLLAYN